MAIPVSYTHLDVYKRQVQILASLMMLSMVFVMVIMARSSAERIVEVLDEKLSLIHI